MAILEEKRLRRPADHMQCGPCLHPDSKNLVFKRHFHSLWDNPGNLYTDQILDEDDKELMLFEGV